MSLYFPQNLLSVCCHSFKEHLLFLTGCFREHLAFGLPLFHYNAIDTYLFHLSYLLYMLWLLCSQNHVFVNSSTARLHILPLPRLDGLLLKLWRNAMSFHSLPSRSLSLSFLVSIVLSPCASLCLFIQLYMPRYLIFSI